MKLPLTIALALLMTTACSSPLTTPATRFQPPVAEQRPHRAVATRRRARGRVLLAARRHPRNPEMLAYLNAENLRGRGDGRQLAAEGPTTIVGRIRQMTAGASRERGWWYYARYETGKITRCTRAAPTARGGRARSAANDAGDCRRAGPADVNRMAEGKDFFSVGNYEVSQITACWPGRGRRRPPPVRDPLQGPRDGRGLRRRDPRRLPSLVGGRQPHAVLRRERPDTLLTVRASTCSARRRPRTLVYEEEDDSFTWASAALRRRIHLHLRAVDGVFRNAAPRPRSRASSLCWPRASATWNTTPTTTTAAG